MVGAAAAGTMGIAATPPGVQVVDRLHYRRIGHTLAAIVFGLFGALLGTVLSARRKSAD